MATSSGRQNQSARAGAVRAKHDVDHTKLWVCPVLDQRDTGAIAKENRRRGVVRVHHAGHAVAAADQNRPRLAADDEGSRLRQRKHEPR